MRKPAAFDGHPMAYEAKPMRGVCQYVVDGDTVDVFVDEGLFDYAYITVRLRDFDAPETRTTNLAEKQHGLLAKSFLQTLVQGQPVKVQTFKDTESFGRFVADIWVWDDEWFLVQDLMRRAGHEKKEVY